MIADTAAVNAESGRSPRRPGSRPSRYSTYGGSANSPSPPSALATMPATVDQIIDALRPVEDPELHRSIVDLGMVRHVEPAADGTVSVLVALDRRRLPAAQRDPAPGRTRRCSPLDGVTGVALDFTVMTDQEREALRQQLQGNGARPRPHPRPATGPRRGPPDPVRPARLAHPPAAHLVRQGRRRQVDASPPTSPSRWPLAGTRSASSTPTSTASRSPACSAPSASPS